MEDSGRPTVRDVWLGLRRTYPPEKRSADYASGVVVGAVYRPLSFAVSAVLIRLGVSANQVTYARYVAITAECITFAGGTYTSAVWGGLCHLCHYLLDYVDGNIARYHLRPTRYGALLDGMADRLGYTLPPVAIGVGLFHRPDALTGALGCPPWLPLALGLAAGGGTALIKTWGMRQLRVLGEFLALLGRASHPATARPDPVPPTARQRSAVGRRRLRAVRAVETAFANAAHVLETGVAVLAALDLASVFLAFRFVYFAASRVWIAIDRLAPPLPDGPRPGHASRPAEPNF